MGHQAGWPDEQLTFATMQAAIDDAYGTLAGALQVGVAPAGQAWQAVASADPGIVLWQSDGSHPAPAGTFLAACVLYTRVFGPCPVNGSDTGGLPAATAATLEVIANQY